MILPAPSQTEKPPGRAPVVRDRPRDTVGAMIAYFAAKLHSSMPVAA
jgi:hypothetical protein